MEPLGQRAPLEGEVKGEMEAEAGMPREDDGIQRPDVEHINDEFLTDVIRAVTRRLQADQITWEGEEDRGVVGNTTASALSM